MTRWELKQLQKKRKEERRAQIINMVGGMLFALMLGAVFFFAR